ncbi:hypothetical protein [Butyrivibrio sp. M55]|jgi:hypothetical protein|uniref:hypothetical protein n=1 Tax=Butyrivibrio sp. M55 TaxID=1855323 RepID=UPI0008F0ED39|nr:hypothetical protein [Butyrivibrio sp. M55]SFU54238.1 hypothetical protein SAMN05216540_103242 [Butyrivibrio sp. M55]
MNEEIQTYVKTFQYLAFADYLIKDHPCYEDWKNNNYINLYGFEGGRAAVDYCSGHLFGAFPLLNHIDRSDEINNDYEKFKETVLKGTEVGKAFYFNVDHYYIKNYSEYGTKHIVHDILLVKRICDGFECIENIYGFLKKTVIEEDDLLRAFSRNKDKCVFELFSNDKKSFSFDYQEFTHMLDDYVNSTDISDHKEIYFHQSGFFSNDFFGDRFKEGTVYGINVYDFIIGCIEKSVGKNEMVDFRLVFILLEKNTNLSEKIRYIKKKGYISGSIDELEDELLEICKALKKIVYLVIMYDTSFNKKYITGIGQLLKELKDQEYEVYNNILKLS